MKYLSQYDSNLRTAIEDIGQDLVDLWVDERITLNSNITVPENVHLYFTRRGVIATASEETVTLTIKGPLTAGLWQIFECNYPDDNYNYDQIDLKIKLGEPKENGTPEKPGMVKEIWAEWFGAVGDSQKDNTSALQAVLHLLCYQEGIARPELRIGPGTFKTSKTLVIKAEEKVSKESDDQKQLVTKKILGGIKITGAGDNTTILNVTKNTDVLHLHASNVTLRDFRLVGGLNSCVCLFARDGIYVADNLFFEGVHLVSSENRGLYWKKDSEGWFSSNNRFINCRFMAHKGHSVDATEINLNTTQFIGCRFDGGYSEKDDSIKEKRLYGKRGIELGSFQAITILGCTVENVDQMIVGGKRPEAFCRNLLIEGCYFENYKQAAIDLGGGPNQAGAVTVSAISNYFNCNGLKYNPTGTTFLLETVFGLLQDNYFTLGSTYLFSIDSNLISELVSGPVSKKLRKEFERKAHGIILSDKANVIVKKKEPEWLIVDTNSDYLIQYENQELAVHATFKNKIIKATNCGYLVIEGESPLRGFFDPDDPDYKPFGNATWRPNNRFISKAMAGFGQCNWDNRGKFNRSLDLKGSTQNFLFILPVKAGDYLRHLGFTIKHLGTNAPTVKVTLEERQLKHADVNGKKLLDNVDKEDKYDLYGYTFDLEAKLGGIRIIPDRQYLLSIEVTADDSGSAWLYGPWIEGNLN